MCVCVNVLGGGPAFLKGGSCWMGLEEPLLEAEGDGPTV